MPSPAKTVFAAKSNLSQNPQKESSIGKSTEDCLKRKREDIDKNDKSEQLSKKIKTEVDEEAQQIKSKNTFLSLLHILLFYKFFSKSYCMIF